MLTDFNFPWARLRQIAAELALKKMDRSVLETISNYIQTERPTEDKLLAWLDAFTQDGYLASRTRRTWTYHRQAKNTVEVLLDDVIRPGKHHMKKLALSLAYISRLLTYFRANRREASALLSEARPLLNEYSERDRPPTIKKRPARKKKKKDDIPEVSNNPSQEAEDFMSFLRSQWEDDE